MAKTRVRGREALKRRLRALPAVVLLDVRDGLAAAAKDVTDMQKRLAPVRDGDLRDSIQFNFGDQKRVRYSQGSRGVKDALTVRITAGNSRVRYAHLVEFGAAPHIAGGLFKGAQHPGAPAQPFFYPAYRSRKKAAASRIKRVMRKSAKKAFEG